jgi:PAS domain S-box-containing protein
MSSNASSRTPLAGDRQTRGVPGSGMAAEQRLALLAEIGRTLSSSLDVKVMLERLAELMVAGLADYCAVDVFDEAGNVERAAVAHRKLDGREIMLEIQRRYPPNLGAATGMGLVLRTGEPILTPEITDEELRARSQDQEHLRLLLRLGPRSVILVPLVAHGRVLGALALSVTEGDRRYDEEDLALAEELAARTAMAVENAQLFQEVQRTARRLEDSVSLLDTLLASAPVGISFLDRDLRFVRINAVMAELHGSDSATVAGRSLREELPDLAPKVEPFYRRVLATGEPVVGLEVSGETPAFPGERRHFLANYYPIRSREGPPVGVGAAVVEITQRKRAEEALRESNQTLSALIQASPLGVMVLRPEDGTVQLWNPAAERIFGWTESEVLGRPLPVVPEDRREELRGILDAVARGEPLQGVETRHRRKDGTPIDVSLWMAAVPAPEGVRVLGIVHDVTERQRLVAERGRLESELRQRVEELAAADRRKDEFLAMLAHELRNPLAAVSNAAYVLDRKSSGDPRSHELLGMVGRQIRHLSRLVDDLLDVSRFSRGKIELRREPVELRRAVEGAVETARPLIEQRRHALTVALPDEPLWLEADVTRIEQIFANLLHNAAKFTEPGGRIELTAERQGSEAVLRVRDDGAGISADLLPHVFDLFVQEERSLARSHGGLGIGLTLVRSLVERHGGSIAAASEGAGRGSEITIRLPLLAREGVDDDASTIVPGKGESDGRPARILLVEDNLDAAEALSELLRMWGHEVAVAHDGVSALRTAVEKTPGVVLLDIGLPGMDGYEVARKMRAIPALAAARLIALTGYGQEADRRRSSLAGVDHHLVKPVDLEQLRSLLGAGPALS